jgi:transcription initiation factor IIE alpha subunit
MIPAYHWKDGAGFFIPGMLLLIFINAIIPVCAQEEEVATEEGQSSTSSLFIALFANGEAVVEYNVGIEDPLAEEMQIKLFGDDIRDLIVVDYEDNVVEFNTGEVPNEIVLNRPNASNLKISYTTSDFLSKDRREWIFNLNSTTSLSVKLPPDSILTDPGENPSIVLVGDQQILTYEPGNVRFVYIIGTLGTEEQANIVITAAESTIAQINNNYPGIVMTSARDLLQRAIDERDNRRFTEAERLADQANDAAIATSREYVAAQEALANAEAQINSAAAGGSGLDNAATMQILQQANNEFAIGNYTEARSSAQDAITALDDIPAQPEIPMPVMIIAIAVAAAAVVAGGIGTMVFFRKRRRTKLVPEVHKANDLPKANINNNDTSSRAPAVFRSSNSVAPVKSKQDIVEVEEQEEVPGSMEETTTSIPPMPRTISDSQIDSSILLHIVHNILVERPHLRPEDQEVLKFLAEKEGAAFESEIRSKFQIPKTTVWRLVKRLEREELVEIRKAGGQNLIKLRFEDKQA